MIIVGEMINTSRKAIGAANEVRDTASVRKVSAEMNGGHKAGSSRCSLSDAESGSDVITRTLNPRSRVRLPDSSPIQGSMPDTADALRWTGTQLRRLRELGAGQDMLAACFDSPDARNRAFQAFEKKAVKEAREQLRRFLTMDMRPHLCRLESRLVETLNRLGFAQVVTPTIISKSQLARMTIDDNHPLSHQVYWINGRQCLRPMLAPNLYSLMVDLGRVAERPIRFFEIGPCFRKESDGARHCSEFTMLNLVEMGLPEDTRQKRLEELGRRIAEAAGISDYRFETERSEVYGDTVDIVAGEMGIEIASGAMGPHALDAAWRVTDTWIGIGFGLERLVMVARGSDTLGKWGKSLAYLNGIRLNI